MSPLSRRTAVRLLAVAASGAAGGLCAADTPVDTLTRRRPVRRALDPHDNAVRRENQNPGDGGFRIAAGTSANDVRRQIQGYTTRTSVDAGQSLDFCVALAKPGHYTITIYRLGHYGGVGGRRMLVSDRLAGGPHPVPMPSADTGLIACDWPVAWTLAVPADWVSGYFLAVFETDDGVRSCTPFVVRNDGRPADFLVVVPFTTYQAYNSWPVDGTTGKNLYHGYASPGKNGGLPYRAHQVSFDRPYAGAGLPSWWHLDTAAVGWLERMGYDVTYATSVDLHAGRVVPDRHAALVFSGHDEYWSAAMRRTVEQTAAAGTHLAFLAANNIYWHIKFGPSGSGQENRIVTCYKNGKDPRTDGTGPTVRWRDLASRRRHAEQRLLGVQYNGIPVDPVPMVIQASGHWFWTGTGLRDGDAIPGLVAGEADGRNPKIKLAHDAVQTLLSHSPYNDRLGRGLRTQNTSLCETTLGGLIFVAGTFRWNLALIESDHTDARVQLAMTNLCARLRERPVD